MHIPEQELSARLESAKQAVQIGGIYRHYSDKTKQYKVLDVALLEASEEPCVVYEAQYGLGLKFVRPVSSWVEMVAVGGGEARRFTRVDP